MVKTNLRSPSCGICGANGKKKGGVKSETNPRVFYERFYVCTSATCPNANKPQSMRAFEGSERAFGERF